MLPLNALLVVLSAVAPQSAVPAAATSLAGLCSSIVSKARAPEESGFRQEYQRIIFQAAGVPSDQQGTEAGLLKVRQYWAGNYSAFSCRSGNFEVIDGNVLKYSVSTRSFGLVRAAIRWKLDLNRVDASDQRTLLDFTLLQLWNGLTTPSRTDLIGLSGELRRAGAKYGCEVSGAKTVPQLLTPPSSGDDPVLAGYRAACTTRR